MTSDAPAKPVTARPSASQANPRFQADIVSPNTATISEIRNSLRTPSVAGKKSAARQPIR